MIEVQNITFGYNAQPVVKGLSLRGQCGQVTTVIGKNGCGKSTLLKLCGRHITPQSGSIKIRGKQVQDYSLSQFAQLVSYLPQGRNVPGMTVFALVCHGRFPHLTFPRKMRQQDYEIVEVALAQAGLTHMKNKYVAELSGGERQRVYMAMALAQNTDIVLLDEPTTYLDMGHQLEIMELVRRLAAMNKCVIMVLHDIGQGLKYSDNILLMESGQALFTGTPTKLWESGLIDKTFGIKTKMVDGNLVITGKL